MSPLRRTIALTLGAASVALLGLSLTPAFAAGDDDATKAAPVADRDKGSDPSGTLRFPVDPWEKVPELPLPPAPEAPVLTLSSSAWTPLGPAPISNGQGVGGPVSGRIAGIAAHPTDANTIYVATAGGGVWKTTNGGAAWTPLTDNQRTLSMGAIALAKSNPSVIYAGTGEANNSADSNFGRGILISTDAGATWTLSTGPGNIFDKMTTSQIAVDPTNPNIAYAAMGNVGNNAAFTPTTGVYKTTNGGATWTNTSTAPLDSSSTWSAVIMDPSAPATTAYAAHGAFYGDAANGAFKSTNSGATWPLLSSGPTGTTTGRFALALAPSSTQVLYTSVAISTSVGSGSLFKMVRSDNGGSTFSDLTAGTPNYLGSQGWYDTTVIADPSNSAIVYVAGAAGAGSILRSTNSGAAWTAISSTGTGSNVPHADHHATDFDANGKLLIAGDGGIYRLDDPVNRTWSNLNGNLNTIQFMGIGLHPTNANIVVGGSQDNGTEVYNGSIAWTLTDGGDGGTAKFSPTNGTRVYHNAPVASFGSSAFFRRSDNTGSTWVSKVTGIAAVNSANFYAPFSVDPNNGDRVLYGTTNVAETTNGGDLWASIGVPGSNGFNAGGASVDAIGIAPSDVNTIYVATGGYFAGSSQIYVTANHGATWTTRNIPGAAHVNEIQVEPTNPLIAYAVINNFSANGHVFRTTNGGVSWSNISGTGGGALPNLPVWSIQVDNTTTPSTLYIGADDGVYSSADLGVTWARFGTGLPNAQCFQLDLNKSLHILGVGTHGRGAWEIVTATPPALTGADSRMTQGAAGTFNVNLPLTGPRGVEDRRGAGSGALRDYTIVLHFDRAVNGGTAAMTGVGSTGPVTFSGNDMIVPLTGVGDVQRVTLTTSNVTTSGGGVLPTASVMIGFLIGDATGDGDVLTADASLVKINSGVPVTSANFRADLNGDGFVDAADATLVRSRSGNSINPPAPDPL